MDGVCWMAMNIWPMMEYLRKEGTTPWVLCTWMLHDAVVVTVHVTHMIPTACMCWLRSPMKRGAVNVKQVMWISPISCLQGSQ
jgi:hypothetical protein